MKKTFLFSVMVCIILTACRVPNSSVPTVEPSVTPKPSLTTTPTVTITSTATSTPTQQASATVTETLLPPPTNTLEAKPAKSVEIVSLEALDSYRLQGKGISKIGDSSTTLTLTYTKEWVKALQAHRSISTSSSNTSKSPPITTEMIKIGKTTWVNYKNSWSRIDSQQPPPSQSQQNANPWQNLMFVGDEIINGIPCKHYRIDEEAFSMSGLGDHQDLTAHQQGDIWVANRADLPPVILRAKIKMDVTGFFGALETPTLTTTNTPDPFLEPVIAATEQPKQQLEDVASDEQYMYDEYDVTEINTTIMIEPPQITPQP